MGAAIDVNPDCASMAYHEETRLTGLLLGEAKRIELGPGGEFFETAQTLLEHRFVGHASDCGLSRQARRVPAL
jgi:hypothetical protein